MLGKQIVKNRVVINIYFGPIISACCSLNKIKKKELLVVISTWYEFVDCGTARSTTVNVVY